MATKTLNFSGSGLDWTDTALWSGGTLPTTGDFVLFDEGKEYRFSVGPASVVDLNGIFLPRSSSLYTEGTAGSFTLDVSNGTDPQCVLLGGGLVRIVGDVDSLTVASANMGFYGSGGAFPLVNARGGYSEFGSTATLATVLATGSGRVKVLSHASDRITRLFVQSRNASVMTERSIDAGTLAAGQLWLSGAATIHTSGVCTVAGGSVEFAGTATAAATLNALGGSVGFSRHEASITIAAVTIDELACRFGNAAPGQTVTITAKTSVSPDWLGATAPAFESLPSGLG